MSLTEAQKQLRKAQQESLKATFETLWRQLDGPELETEYRFWPGRKWAIDFFHRDAKIGIEVEGGVHVGGRHVRGVGYTNDCIKYNCVTRLGIRLFRLTSDMLTQQEGPEHLQPIIELMKRDA